MSTFFDGLNEFQNLLAKNVGAGKYQQPYTCFPGVVLEICMDSSPTNNLYQSERDIGKIKFQNLVTEYNSDEKLLTSEAYPLDRSIARYPYPGEEVIIYAAVGENTSTTAPTMAGIYYYSFVVSAMHNITYNQNPFIGTDWKHTDLGNDAVKYNTAKLRFDKKTIDINTVKDFDNSIKVYKQLKPQEGDFILQGRFGTSVRFGSTAVGGNSPWSSNESSGVSGDGIVVIRADRSYVTDEKSMLASENIDEDDSSIYLCTSQNVPITLACSKRMKSWAAVYNLEDTGNSNAAGTLSNQKDSSELWQKVIESDQPVSETFNPVD